jgi:hypothetical protein
MTGKSLTDGGCNVTGGWVMTTEPLQKQPEKLSSSLFQKYLFNVRWMVVLVLFFLFVSWPLRDIALVCWVYGWPAYFHDGIHVLPGKPEKFSDGVEVPTLPGLVVSIGAFFITFIGLTLLLIFAQRCYERHRAKKKEHDS